MKKNILIFILVILAALKYFWFLPRLPFDADQEYLAQKSAEILSGKLTLLGAPTSIGGMFIGPLYSYFAAAAMFIFKGNPLTINGLSAFWAVLTIIALYLVGKRLFGNLAGFFAATIGLISSKFLDIGKNPPLSIPLTLITLIFLVVISLPKSRRRDLLLGLLAGLSLNLHFSGIFFLPILLTIGTSGLIGILIPVTPLIAFELKHNFFIIRNAISFLSTQTKIGEPTTLYHRFKVFINSLSELIRFPAGPFLELLAKIITIVILILSFKLAKNRVVLACLYLPLVFFLLYPGHLLPYYAAMSWGPFILIIGTSVSKLWNRYRRLRPVIIIAMVISTVFHFKSWSQPSTGRGLDKKLAALQYIKLATKDKPFYLSKTMYPTADFGYTYLIKYMDIHSATTPIDPTYTLVSPYNWHEIQPDLRFGDIGIVLPKPEHSENSENQKIR